MMTTLPTPSVLDPIQASFYGHVARKHGGCDIHCQMLVSTSSIDLETGLFEMSVEHGPYVGLSIGIGRFPPHQGVIPEICDVIERSWSLIRGQHDARQDAFQ